jgi:sugar/nucleoside kinase (ribokinase family)
VAPAHLDLLTAGETFDDLVFFGLTRLPDAGQELKTPNFYRSPGGGALITAVAAARLGVRCGVVSGLSDDSARLLRRERVVVRNLRGRSEPWAITVALSSPRDRRFITFGGVNERLPGRIRKVVSRARARHVHFAFVPRPCRPWLGVVDRLRRRGISTSWDFGWDDRLTRDPHFRSVAESVDYLFVNRDEMLMYSGAARLGAAIERWRRAPRHVVVKLGAAGSRLVGGGVDVRAPAVRVRSVESTGAGDAFNGGFLAACLRGRPLRAALVLGNRIGALSTRRPGGIAGLPGRKEQT